MTGKNGKQKKKQNRKQNRKHFAAFLKIFFGTLFGILVLGAIALFSLHLVIKMPGANSQKQKGETQIIEEFPETVQQIEQNDKIPIGKYGEILEDKERMTAENIHAREGKTEGQTTLLFGGDFLLDPNYAVMATLLKKGGNVEDAIEPQLLDKMRDADICMLNNEFPYSLRGTPTPEKAFTFRAKPEYAKLVTQMGIDVVSLANNHAYDYGEDALRDTFAALTQENILYVGAGNDREEATRPLYFIINDMKIAIVSATQIERLDNPDTKEATENTPGVFRCWNPERIYEVIEEAEKNSDFVIVFVHWGTENQVEVDWAQEEQAPKYVEAGADLIIGTHPHCLQKIEYIGEVPVVYSMGNFWFNSKPLDTALLSATLTKEGLEKIEWIPCRQEKSATSLLQGTEKQRLISYMNEISPNIFIDEEGNVGKRE